MISPKLIFKRHVSGFTLVELLIVIVIIAILAAISIVAYNGIQDRAANSVAKADMTNVIKQFSIHKIDNGGYIKTDTWTNFHTPMLAMELDISTDAFKQFIYIGDGTGDFYGLLAETKAGTMLCYSTVNGGPSDCSSQLTATGFPEQGLGKFKDYMGISISQGRWAFSETTGWADWVGSGD